jgi:tetratricopeptide (TPR) repeat protein
MMAVVQPRRTHEMFGWFQKKAPPEGDDLDPNRAADFYRRRDFAEALRRADVMLAACPQVALSWRFKGECLFQIDRFGEAEACFRRAHEIGGPGTDDVLFWAGFCQHNVGRREAAVSTLLGYIATLPSEATERRRQAERALVAFRGQPEAGPGAAADRGGM